jgi:hypothetical protein
LRSPAKDALEPVNEKNGKGTGIGTLMPTWMKATYVNMHEFHRVPILCSNKLPLPLPKGA